MDAGILSRGNRISLHFRLIPLFSSSKGVSRNQQGERSQNLANKKKLPYFPSFTYFLPLFPSSQFLPPPLPSLQKLLVVGHPHCLPPFPKYAPGFIYGSFWLNKLHLVFTFFFANVGHKKFRQVRPCPLYLN